MCVFFVFALKFLTICILPAANNLRGTTPPEFSVLSSLEQIHFYSNSLSGSLPDITGFSQLIMFDMELNSFSGLAFPRFMDENIADLSSLTDYLISSNRLTGTIPRLIGALTSLKNLWTVANRITGTIPPRILSATNLETVYIGDNRISGTIPNTMGLLKNMRQFYANNNTLTGTIPESFSDLAFEELRLQGNQLEGPLVELNADVLTDLWLEDNLLSGSIPASLASGSLLGK